MKTFKRALSIFMCLVMLTGTISLFSFYSSAAEDEATELYVGSVLLRPGEYLAEGSTTPSYKKPSGDYIEFTGGKVNMYNFDYTGPGHTVNHSGGTITAAIHLNGKSAIYVSGENSINITGDTYCTGIFSSGSLTIRDTSYYGSSLDISGSVKTGIFMPTEGSKLNVLLAAVIISGATVEDSYGIKCNGDIDFGSDAYINISAMRKGIISSSKIDFTSYSSVNIEVSRIALVGDLSTTEINFKGGYVCLKAGQYIVDCDYSNITGLENLNGVAGINKNGSGAVAFNKSDILTYKYAELVHNTLKEYHYGLIGNKAVTPGVKLSEIEITLDEFFCYNSLIKDFTPGVWKKSIKFSSELSDFTECAADEAAQDGYYYLKEFTVSFKEGVIVDTSKAYLDFRGVSGFSSYRAKCLSNGDGTYLLYIYDNYVTGDDIFKEGYSLTIKNYLPDYDISRKIEEGGSVGLYALPYSDYKKFVRWENTVNLDKVSNYADFDPLKYSFSFKMPA